VADAPDAARAGAQDAARAGAQDAARADDAFGADLFPRLGSGDGNMIFSPASIAAALRMALLGARGETAAQLAATLHLAGPQGAADGLRLLSARLAGLGRGDVTFRAPNTMWVQTGLPLLPQFTGALDGMAGMAATVRDADFAHAADQARLEINEAIAEQTAGKIANLLGPGVIDTATRLVLANAVYLKAAWAHPFPPGATADAPFHPGSGAEIVVRMMRLAARLGYRRGNGYQAVVLPYAGQELAMAVVLPDGPLAPMEERLASGGIRGLLAGAGQQQVRLALPGFRLTAAASLRQPLEALGARLAFSREDADFSGITAATRLWIDEVVHQAYIDVDEQGTAAAAATATAVATARFAVPGPPPVEVTVDRPFLFAITDTATGLPLFLGRVTNPLAG
jgi:serpin B